MQIKMTQKDKMLLMVLAIIVVVFAAVMIPSYGIKDLITKSNELKTQIAEQETANTNKLNSLKEAGIKAGVADNSALALRSLERTILEKKYVAAMFAEALAPYSIATLSYQWFDNVCYLNGINDEYQSFCSDVREEAGANNVVKIGVQEVPDQPFDTIDVTIARYMVVVNVADKDYDRKITINSEGAYEENSINYYAPLLMYLRNMEQKGSIYIDSYAYEDGKFEVSFRLLMVGSENGEFSKYASEVSKCPVCEEVYSGEHVCEGAEE